MSWRARCGAGEQAHIEERAPPEPLIGGGAEAEIFTFHPMGKPRRHAAARPSKQASDSAFPSSRKEQVLHFNRQFFFESEKGFLYVTIVLNLI